MVAFYQNLGNAIILRAVTDWRKATHWLQKCPESQSAQQVLKECEEFFLSNWFELLTNLDGDVLLKQLKREADS